MSAVQGSVEVPSAITFVTGSYCQQLSVHTLTPYFSYIQQKQYPLIYTFSPFLKILQFWINFSPSDTCSMFHPSHHLDMNTLITHGKVQNYKAPCYIILPFASHYLCLNTLLSNPFQHSNTPECLRVAIYSKIQFQSTSKNNLLLSLKHLILLPDL